uniref:Uncharacterized protein n=1 Tax=Oryza meridionalis TaxID=40149 RepID=A0A0E0EPG9_9ORYZ
MGWDRINPLLKPNLTDELVPPGTSEQRDDGLLALGRRWARAKADGSSDGSGGGLGDSGSRGGEGGSGDGWLRQPRSSARPTAMVAVAGAEAEADNALLSAAEWMPARRWGLTAMRPWEAKEKKRLPREERRRRLPAVAAVVAEREVRAEEAAAIFALPAYLLVARL